MYFPLFLDISGAKFLIIGGGNVALAKVEAILEFSPNITLLAKNFSAKLDNINNFKSLKLIEKSFMASDLDGFDVIIAATNDNDLNSKIAKLAKSQQKLVNIVDDPKNSSFIFGATIKKSGITVAISTSGIAPVLARLLKQTIQKTLPQNLALLSDFLNKNKELIRKKLPRLQARRLFYEDFLKSTTISEIEASNIKNAQKLLENSLTKKAANNTGAVYFISAGPGDPELVTLKAIKLLSRADVVLYDRLVASEILDYARRDAIKINVGKVKDFHLKSQEQINQLLYQYGQEGKIVARLKGGDATIFARLSEEIDAIKKLNIPYQIVPGVTAASGAAAHAGISLTSRHAQKSVKFLSLYKKDQQDDKFFKDLAQSNDTLVFYMSSHNLELISKKLTDFGKKASTKIAIIEQATTKYQKTYISTLQNFAKDFPNKKFTSPGLAIIGDVVSWHEKHKWRQEDLEGEYFAKLGGSNAQS